MKDAPLSDPSQQASVPPSGGSGWSASSLIYALLVALLLVAAMFAGVRDAKVRALLEEGTSAPDFAFEKHAEPGRVVELRDFAGKVVMLDFWATWCPPCVKEMPMLVEVAQAYQDRGVVLVAASDDEVSERPAAVGVFIETKVKGLLPHAYYASPIALRRYLVQSLPTLYIIGRDGKIVAARSGLAAEWEVRRWLDMALQQKK